MNMNDILHGTLKLKNDPKVTSFTSKNIILRGEVLSSINWIFGMVMRVGHDCSKLD